MLVAAQLLTCTVEDIKSSHTVIEVHVYVLEYSSNKYLSFNYTM